MVIQFLALDIAFYGSSEIIWTTNFTIYTVHATIFVQFSAAFHFFSKYIGKADNFVEKFLIVNHPKEYDNEGGFKRYIPGRILDLLKKSSKRREASI